MADYRRIRLRGPQTLRHAPGRPARVPDRDRRHRHDRQRRRVAADLDGAPPLPRLPGPRAPRDRRARVGAVLRRRRLVPPLRPRRDLAADPGAGAREGAHRDHASPRRRVRARRARRDGPHGGRHGRADRQDPPRLPHAPPAAGGGALVQGLRVRASRSPTPSASPRCCRRTATARVAITPKGTAGPPSDARASSPRSCASAPARGSRAHEPARRARSLLPRLQAAARGARALARRAVVDRRAA